MLDEWGLQLPGFPTGLFVDVAAAEAGVSAGAMRAGILTTVS